MTRVSDAPAFADAVARGGALPFLALALLRQAETETLLRETSDRLGPKPWGVGILGFVPAEIRKEQLAAIRTYRPPFALIAGGRPDQARELEDEGSRPICTSPHRACSASSCATGRRRFVFEGRECGGHVGPADELRALGNDDRGPPGAPRFRRPRRGTLDRLRGRDPRCPVRRDGRRPGRAAGGAWRRHRGADGHRLPVHPRGGRGGAITPRFQQEALRCSDTVLLETAPGTRSAAPRALTATTSSASGARLQAEGDSPEEIARALEWRNIGRLRIASKGLDRRPGWSGRLAAGRDPRGRAVRPGHVHDRATRLPARRDHHDRGAPRGRLWRGPPTSGGAGPGGGPCRGAAPRAVRRGDHRHGVLLPQGQRPCRVLAEHPRPGASGHGDPRDALGLAALLRPEPPGP